MMKPSRRSTSSRRSVPTLLFRRFTPHVTMHVKITVTRRARLRLWLSKRLLRLAARVAGMGIKIETSAKNPKYR